MENILDLYAKPHNPKEPVVCFDEKSIQLLQDVRDPISTTPTAVRKRDYEYKRNGTRNIFVSVEPQGGRRQASVTERRTKVDFAEEIKKLANRYPKADTIHLVMDNLNTHSKKSLIKTFGEEEADSIWSRLTVHYTPKHASWLNMAEIEIGILSRQALRQRLGDEDILKKAVRVWQTQRNRQRKKINWRFTKKDARKALKCSPKELD